MMPVPNCFLLKELSKMVRIHPVHSNGTLHSALIALPDLLDVLFQERPFVKKTRILKRGSCEPEGLRAVLSRTMAPKP